MLVKADEEIGDDSIDLGESPKKKLKFQVARKRDRSSVGTEEQEEEEDDNFSEKFLAESNDSDFDNINEIEEELSTPEVKKNVIEGDVKKSVHLSLII